MRSAITRDQYDAVLFDLDGVITDTANMHAACWKQMFDAYLQKRAADPEANHFVLSILPRITGSMWMGSPDSTAFATFSHHAVSSSLREARTTPRRPKQWAGSGTARMTWSTKSSKTIGVEPYEGSVKLIHQLRRSRVQNRRRHLKSELRRPS